MTNRELKKINVIFLLDSLSVPAWIFHIYDFLIDNEKFKVAAVVINGNPVSSQNAFMYRVLRKVDRTLFKFEPNPFERKTLSLQPGTEQLILNPLQKKYSDFFSADDVEKIRSFEPDLILRFGFRIIRGEILSVPTYGIWSLHHGDNSVNRGGPPAFWEVVLKEPVTGVTLQKLTEDLDGGGVIAKAYVKTDYTSFYRNQAALYWSGTELFKNKLNELAKDQMHISFTTEPESTLNHFYSHQLYKDPGNLKSYSIGLKFFYNSFIRKLNDHFYNEQWAIGYAVKSGIESSLYRYKTLDPPKGYTWADPFPIEVNNNVYIFAEQKKGVQNGEIICFKYENYSNLFKNLGVVLNQPFHLSYPFVFQYDTGIYMVPESGSINKVILYESKEFPFKWVQKKVLLDNVTAFDATLHLHEGIWYMFATVKSNPGISANEQLNIYYTNDLIHGEWKSHKMNPVKHDVRGARPAGRIFIYNNRLFRPGQIASFKYGYGVQFYEIITLNPDAYEEVKVTDMEPLWNTNLLATHTFNYIPGLSVIDFQRKQSRY
jgi:hypothetical protein